MTTDSHEPSYYEIALTNRQVLVAFVLILGSVFGAFLCGVWVGKGSGSLLAREVEGAAPGGEKAAENLDDLESFRFFSDTDKAAEGEEELKKPDLSRLLEEPRADTTLAEDVGAASEPAPAEATPDETTPEEPSPEETLAAAETAPPAAPPPPVAPPPPAVAAPPPTAPAAAEGFIVQVFSSHDREQARKIHGQLVAAEFKAFIAPLEKNGETLYRVRIGPFAQRARAERAEREVKAKFKLETWVTAASN